MSKLQKVKDKILDRAQRGNVTFDDLCYFLERSGFDSRQKGSHKIFTKDGVEEIINLQCGPNGTAKRYQVAIVADIVLQYDL